MYLENVKSVSLIAASCASCNTISMRSDQLLYFTYLRLYGNSDELRVNIMHCFEDRWTVQRTEPLHT